VLLPHLSPSSNGTPPLMMAYLHGHVQQSAHTVLDLRAPCHYMERRRGFRQQGRNADRSCRYVDEVMRQVQVQTIDARDDAFGAGILNQLPKHEPCSNGHDPCDDWATGHSRLRITRRRRLSQMMIMSCPTRETEVMMMIETMMMIEKWRRSKEDYMDLRKSSTMAEK